jgi:putative methyltransferase
MYLSAAKAVDAVDGGRSFKSHCGSQKHIGKPDFALAAETLKYAEVLEDVFRRVGVSATTLDVGRGMMKVLAYELLFGQGKITGGGAVKRKLMEFHEQLKEALLQVMEEKGATSHSGLLSAQVTISSSMKKYARINLLKVPVSDQQSCLMEVQRLIPKAEMDDLIPALIVLPPERSLGQHALVQEGKLIIQDKASCFPSQCLYDAWQTSARGDLVDCCAAPGNKTSHLAALLSKHSGVHKIFAFDKDVKRANLLKLRMAEAGADSVVTTNTDFLSLDVNSVEYSQVTGVLLDPSCSGSGVARALERVIASSKGTNYDAERLNKLRNFQLEALKKAMTFPAAVHVVYSTCSINIEENESVVEEVLAAVNAPSSSTAWSLVAPSRFAAWARRGDVDYPGLTPAQLQCLIRCHPSDGLNGFFVAVFEKRKKVQDKSTSSDVDPALPAHPSTSPGVKRRRADGELGKKMKRKRRWMPFDQLSFH